MSIHKMIAARPDVAGNVKEELATATRHAMLCGDLHVLRGGVLG